MKDCLFCKIVNGEVSSEKVYEDDEVVAFKDIHPVAPVHMLIIPKKHIGTLNDMEECDEKTFGKIFTVIRKIAKEQGIDEKGYRVISNCGHDGGQVVGHVHFHLIGGKHLGPKIIK